MVASLAVSLTGASADADAGVREVEVSFESPLPCAYALCPLRDADTICGPAPTVHEDSWDEVRFTVPSSTDLGFAPRWVRFGDTDNTTSASSGFLCRFPTATSGDGRWVATAWRGSDCDEPLGALPCYREEAAPSFAGDHLSFRVVNYADLPRVEGTYAICATECRTV